MSLEDAAVSYHAELAQQEPAAIAEQTALITAAAAEVQAAVDKQTDGADTLDDGWWLAVIAALGFLRNRWRLLLIRATEDRLIAVAVAAVIALERAVEESGDDVPLAAVSRERLTRAALAGPGGRSWPEWSARNVDAMFHRLSGQFRTAHTRAEVGDLVAQARRLAINAATSTTVTGMHSAANRARLVAAGDDGRFTRWRYAAVMDNRTSETCIELNGTEWLFADQNAPFPPRHPNCRSVVVPLE